MLEPLPEKGLSQRKYVAETAHRLRHRLEDGVNAYTSLYANQRRHYVLDLPSLVSWKCEASLNCNNEKLELIVDVSFLSVDICHGQSFTRLISN